MRWIFIVLVMCNGIYFLWQNYLVQSDRPVPSEVATRIPEGTPSLQLLSERPDLPAGGDTEQAAAPEPASTPEPAAEAVAEKSKSAAAEAPVSNICWQIGPFKEVVSGKQVVSRLAAMGIDLKLQSVEIPDKPDYWVHIPPQVSRREAIKLLRELQAKKIDSFLIGDGDLANGISLGFFTQKDRAEKVRDLHRKQGYDVEIKEVPRTHTELWATFDERKYGELTDALWQKIIEGNQGLERRKNYCDKIASTGNID